MAKVEFYNYKWQRLQSPKAAALAYTNSQNIVGYKGNRFYVGQKVEIKPFGRLDTKDGQEVKQYATVKSLKKGLPDTIEINGSLESVFGYIIQIIPFLIRLIDSIKELIKSLKS